MASDLLRLDDNKTEVLFIRSQHMMQKIPDSVLHIGNDISLLVTARNIGALFDNSLSINTHISHICKSFWHHLRQVGLIRHYLDLLEYSSPCSAQNKTDGHIMPVLIDLNWLPIEQRIDYKILLLTFFKALHFCRHLFT